MDDALAYYWSLPVLTRSWLTLTASITVAASFDVLDRRMLIFDWNRIYHHTEWWRLLTSFCYAGGHLKQFHVLILIYLILNVARPYERSPLNTGAGGTRADAAFAGLFCAVTIVGTTPLLNAYGPTVLKYFGYKYARWFRMEPVFTRTLVYAILYLWSRRNPNARANINMVPVQGRYLPFAHMALGYFLNHRLHEMVHGLVVGHLFFYWTIVVPSVTQGRMGASTPQFLREFCDENNHVRLLEAEQEYEANRLLRQQQERDQQIQRQNQLHPHQD